MKGTIGDVIFYESIDGFLARTKGGIEASRIYNDPAFARTRENYTEFRNAVQAAKVLRDCICTLSTKSIDNRLTSRLNKLMWQIKDTDVSSIRGSRMVAAGIATDEGKQLMKGFDFNNRAPLGSVLHTLYELDRSAGALVIPLLRTMNDISIPPGATGIVCKLGYAVVDFSTGQSALSTSSVRLPIVKEPVEVKLLPGGIPAIPGTPIIILCIEFMQEVNGADYLLNNGANNVMTILEVL